MKVSVIVPSYNAEKYIAETLDCLLAQTLGDIEIIAVDDGSKDSTAQILASYCEKHSNIVYVYQQNSGVSAARNAGLQRATGKYVLFLDADDLLGGDTLELFYNRLEQTGADVGICRLESFGYGGCESNANADMLAAMDEIGVYDRLLLWNYLVSNKFYRRDKLVQSGVRFPAIGYAEDGAFFMPYVLLAKPAIVGTAGAIMRYRRHYPQDGFSVSQSISFKLASDCVKAMEIIYDAAVMSLSAADCGCDDREGYLQELNYKSFYILVMQFYRLIWRTDAPTRELIAQACRKYTGAMAEQTLAKARLLHKDIGPELCFDRSAIANKPFLSAIIPAASPQAINSVFLQSMPSFELFVSEGTVIPEAWQACENLRVLPAKGFKSAARKAARGEMTLTFSGKKPLSNKLFKIISLLKKSKKFSFFPAPLIKLGAQLLCIIRK